MVSGIEDVDYGSSHCFVLVICVISLLRLDSGCWFGLRSDNLRGRWAFLKFAVTREEPRAEQRGWA